MRCCVPSCLNDTKKPTESESLTFHKFPKDVDHRKTWLEALAIFEWEPDDTSVVCSEHFQQDAFADSKCRIRKVKMEAVPISEIEIFTVLQKEEVKQEILEEDEYDIKDVQVKREVLDDETPDICDSINSATDKCHVADEVAEEKNTVLNPQTIKKEEEVSSSCIPCEFSCEDEVSLTNQMKIHGEKSFVCKLCDFKTAYEEYLERHMRNHDGEKLYSCTTCDYTCKASSSFSRHMRKHAVEMPYSCRWCDYTCAYKEYLHKHMRIHTSEKPFSCNSCDYSCKTSSSLTRHMRIHTGEKPYVCQKCEYRTIYKECLVRHMRIHTGEKPFSCSSCNYSCRVKSYLSQHMKIHAGERHMHNEIVENDT